MAFASQEEGIGRGTKDQWDTLEVPAVNTCSIADILQETDTMSNSLDFSGVYITPTTRDQKEPLPVDFQFSEAAAARRMPFSPSAQDSPSSFLDTNDLCLGLQSFSLPGWNRPRSSQDLDAAAQPSKQSALNMFSNPLGKTPLDFWPQNHISSELTDNLPTSTLSFTCLDSSHSLLCLCSSRLLDSGTSGFSSGSGQLSECNLHISPPLPVLPISGMTWDSLIGSQSHLNQDQHALQAATSSLANVTEQWLRTSIWPPWSLPDSPDDPFSIERKAQLHRQAAAVTEPTRRWSGHLPARNYQNPIYSRKVFLGGVPCDITERDFISTFHVFGLLSVDWPGYVYLVFESERCVLALLQNCSQNVMRPNGVTEYYFKMSSTRIHCKEIQVIPWVLEDSNFVCSSTQSKHNLGKTVFVGALHGMLNAEALASIFNDLFGGVMYAGIDTDRYKYPIGSGRVTFDNQHSYLKAVNAAVVEIRTTRFIKKVQIDPYVEESLCQECGSQPGPFFCRDKICFKLFCRPCWKQKHSKEILHHHRPLMRNASLIEGLRAAGSYSSIGLPQEDRPSILASARFQAEGENPLE